jgi:hypothetical protein
MTSFLKKRSFQKKLNHRTVVAGMKLVKRLYIISGDIADMLKNIFI